MSEKIIGYSLLTLGVVIIFLSSFSVFTVFTGRAKPVQLFNFESVSIDFSQIISASLPTTNLSSAPGPKTEIIKGDMLNTTSNIFAHLVLMGFLASSGLKLAQIGVNLLRPIVVKIKEEKLLKAVNNQQNPS